MFISIDNNMLGYLLAVAKSEKNRIHFDAYKHIGLHTLNNNTVLYSTNGHMMMFTYCITPPDMPNGDFFIPFDRAETLYLTAKALKQPMLNIPDTLILPGESDDLGFSLFRLYYTVKDMSGSLVTDTWIPAQDCIQSQKDMALYMPDKKAEYVTVTTEKLKENSLFFAYPKKDNPRTCPKWDHAALVCTHRGLEKNTEQYTKFVF